LRSLRDLLIPGQFFDRLVYFFAALVDFQEQEDSFSGLIRNLL